MEPLVAEWHDFYVASTGATAVLLGLTFVGLTIHLERRGLDTVRRSLALSSATSLVYALLTSLLMLVPEGDPYVQAIGLGLIAIGGLISAQAALAEARRGHLSRGVLALQFIAPYVALVLLVLAGIGFALSLEPALWAAGAVVFLLIVAGTQSAWDLLFRFAPSAENAG
jgi:hypothetical protein